jgi:hypothetical protein
MGGGAFGHETHASQLPAEILTRQAKVANAGQDCIFRLGEVVELRGSRFRVMDMTRTYLVLRSLPQPETSRPS